MPLLYAAVNGVVSELLHFSLTSSSISLFLVIASLDARLISVTDLIQLLKSFKKIEFNNIIDQIFNLNLGKRSTDTSISQNLKQKNEENE
jgi:hypothetical protein